MSVTFIPGGRWAFDVNEAAIACESLRCLDGAKVLVTGATGLIGSCLADLLLEGTRGISVTVAGRDEQRLRERFAGHANRITYVPFDAGASDDISGSYDYVYHCAAIAHPRAYSLKPIETFLANVRGTHAVLKCVERHGGRLVFVSSSEVYGSLDGTGPYAESDYGVVDPLDARSCYPESKRCSEALCSAFAREHGVDFVVVRPGHVYGPTMSDADSRAHAQFARSAAAGSPIVMKSRGGQLRSYVHVLDCATAMVTVAHCGTSCLAYNVSNRYSVVTIRQMAEAFARAGGVPITFDDPTEVELAGFNRMDCSALDARLLEELGWAGAYTMDAGAKETVTVLGEK